jgi:hypothetical protein
MCVLSMKIRILTFLVAIALPVAVAQAQPVIAFETNEIVVSGAAGHQVALLLEGSRVFIGVMEPGGDGLAHFPVPKSTVMSAIAVDAITGQIGFAATGATPQPVSMPAGLIMRGTSGAWSRLVLPESLTRFLWIRPGQGAWGAVASTLTDEDSTSGNGVRFTQTSALSAFFYNGNPTTPPGFQNGDIFIALGGSSTRMSGTVDGQLSSSSAGVILFASPSSFNVAEGTSREIVVMRTLGTANTVSVRLRSVPGTATPGVDYTALNQILTFDAGEAIKKSTFGTIDDDAYNTPVALTMELLDASGTTIAGGATRNVDIGNNDPLPVIAFGSVPASVAEQNAPWTLSLPLVLTGKTRVNATVNYYAVLRDGLAGTTGSVTFTPGQTTAAIPLTIPGDTKPEANYDYTVMLNPGANNVVGVPNTAHVTITNDDVSSLSVADVSVAETDAAGTSAMFHIALSQAMPQEVRVAYTTASLEATSGSDFAAKSGVAVFPPGQTSVLIHVDILGDTVPESDEKFNFILSDPVNATIARAVATGTIRDDDTSNTAPALSVSASTVIEKTGTNSDAAFRITLSPPQAQEVRVSYATVDGLATAPADYISTSGVATFAPGETSKVITVPVIGDSAIEPNEGFSLLLSSPAGATITAPGRAEITVVDDDQPLIHVSDMTVSENASVAVLTLRITPPVNRAATVSWSTANGTATAGQDYVAATGSATFADSQSIIIEILQDGALESSETFYADFTSVTNATLERQRVAITILDDDRQASARVAVSDTSVIEATGNEVTATFQVTLTSPVSSEVRVSYATSDLTAFSGADYIPASGILVFTPGQTSATVAVTIFGDAIAEADEKFRLTLSNPVNATIARSPAEATIQDDDSGPRPSLSILPVKVIEGTGANTDAVFLVTLSATSNTEVRVDFATANGNALEGVDYVATSGTLTFAPGELTKMIVVPVVGDSNAEPEERFSVALTNASGALIAIPNATGTIVDDDVTRFRSVRH